MKKNILLHAFSLWKNARRNIDLGLGVRAGFRKRSDGRRTPKFLRSVSRDNAPPDAKPLVSGWPFYCT